MPAAHQCIQVPAELSATFAAATRYPRSASVVDNLSQYQGPYICVEAEVSRCMGNHGNMQAHEQLPVSAAEEEDA